MFLDSMSVPVLLRGALAVLVALSSGACGSMVEGDIAENSAEIVNGQPSTDEQNAVVVVARVGNWCTGSVVANNLVLTARHCLFDYASTFDCQVGTPVTRAFRPEWFEIWYGSERPLDSVARGKTIYSGPQLDLCDNEVALLEVDTSLKAEPLRLRLDDRPSVHETGVVVGWGASELPHNSEAPRLEAQRHQRETTILATAGQDYPLPGNTSRPTRDGTFVTGEAGCYGDSGAPFLVDSSVVVGVVSLKEPLDPTEQVHPEKDVASCFGTTTVFADLWSQRQWIRQAFVDAGQTPWLEGHNRPAKLGERCVDDAACSSGLCLKTTNGSFCSRRCAETAACPEGYQCLEPADGEQFCVPSRLQTAAPGSNGCGFAHGSGPSPATLIGVVVSALALAARGAGRRRARLARAYLSSRTLENLP